MVLRSGKKNYALLRFESVRLRRVGWVEFGETHQICLWREWWVSFNSTHPTHPVRLESVTQGQLAGRP